MWAHLGDAVGSVPLYHHKASQIKQVVIWLAERHAFNLWKMQHPWSAMKPGLPIFEITGELPNYQITKMPNCFLYPSPWKVPASPTNWSSEGLSHLLKDTQLASDKFRSASLQSLRFLSYGPQRQCVLNPRHCLPDSLPSNWILEGLGWSQGFIHQWRHWVWAGAMQVKPILPLFCRHPFKMKDSIVSGYPQEGVLRV